MKVTEADAARKQKQDPPASIYDLAALLGVTVDGLRGLAELPYRRFMREKRDGSQRPMAEPAGPLKQAQEALLREVWGGYRIHDAAHGVTGRSAATNARAHAGAVALLKLDARDFYPSISARRIAAFLVGTGVERDVARMLAVLATVPEPDDTRWLPQGAPTSPVIANVLSYRLDSRLSGLARAKGATYTRYVDDFIFSWRGQPSDHTTRGAREDALRIIRAEGFEVNPGKTRILRTPARVTGYVVSPDGSIRVSRESRRALRREEYKASLGQGDHRVLAGLRSLHAGEA